MFLLPGIGRNILNPKPQTRRPEIRKPLNLKLYSQTLVDPKPLTKPYTPQTPERSRPPVAGSAIVSMRDRSDAELAQRAPTLRIQGVPCV